MMSEYVRRLELMIDQQKDRIRELEGAMMTWTQKIPTGPGRYWWRDIMCPGQEPTVFHVQYTGTELTIQNWRIRGSYLETRGEWWGPIEVPK